MSLWNRCMQRWFFLQIVLHLLIGTAVVPTYLCNQLYFKHRRQSEEAVKFRDGGCRLESAHNDSYRKLHNTDKLWIIWSSENFIEWMSISLPLWEWWCAGEAQHKQIHKRYISMDEGDSQSRDVYFSSIHKFSRDFQLLWSFIKSKRGLNLDNATFHRTAAFNRLISHTHVWRDRSKDDTLWGGQRIHKKDGKNTVILLSHSSPYAKGETPKWHVYDHVYKPICHFRLSPDQTR